MAGSILGAYFGMEGLKERWLAPFNDDLRTGLAWFYERWLGAMAKTMGRLPRRVAEKSTDLMTSKDDLRTGRVRFWGAPKERTRSLGEVARVIKMDFERFDLEIDRHPDWNHRWLQPPQIAYLVSTLDRRGNANLTPVTMGTAMIWPGIGDFET